MSAAGWIREQREIYFGNAELKKDYRVRLRGSRVAWVLAFYLGLFLLITLGIFGSMMGEQVSVVEAQSRLQTLYVYVTVMLEALALFIAPAVAAAAIVAEHQRKSDDLIFVAPITLKYFLVGKLLSGLRYLLVMFALALPMAAACVVLGGATWREVVLAYLILCFRSCFYLALALPIAAATKKVVSAFILTLLAIGVLVMLGSTFGVGGLLGASGMTGVMGMPGQVPFYSYVLPFTSAFGADTFTLLPGLNWQVPNWILVGLLYLLLTKFLLVTAASSYSNYGRKDIASLRAHALVLGVVFLWLFQLAGFVTTFAYGRLESVAALFAVCIPLVFAMHSLGAWSIDADRKNYPDGLFRWREFWRGSPSSGLPFLLTFMGVLVVAHLLGNAATAAMSGLFFQWPSELYWARVLWLATLVLLIWSFYWLMSGLIPRKLDVSKKASFVMYIVVFLLPMPFFIGIDALEWEYFFLAAGFAGEVSSVLTVAGVQLLLAVLFTGIAEKARKRYLRQEPGRAVAA